MHLMIIRLSLLQSLSAHVLDIYELFIFYILATTVLYLLLELVHLLLEFILAYCPLEFRVSHLFFQGIFSLLFFSSFQFFGPG